MPQPALILASQSPRRRELLAQIGLDFTVQPAHIDESHHSGESPADFVERMALEKALAVAADLPEEAVVIGSDTVVVVDDWIMGKPRDRAHALSMLSALSGRSHRVLSSVAVVGGNRQAVAMSDNRVHFRAITEAEMTAYWNSGEPVDKAGGYAIQGKGAVFVEKMHGSYSAVMGLPLFETAKLLAAYRITPWP
ncbi:septum formation protein [Natronospira proteinivora]|uniref:dTTP/UTP pyrophosphatase n=1 Tax=Natronospira proteinivora TaxID=1807133 RepID=A0ABT1G8P4_9GAMM|nr:Maf family protein [Natronospira proteinivora]MCP1727693.1 septum formation protein [Natronospira proteinivora]